MGDMMIVLVPDSETAVAEGIIASVERLPLLGFERMDDHYIDLIITDEDGNPVDVEDIYVNRIFTDGNGHVGSRHVPFEYFNDKYICRIYWDNNPELTDENNESLKEATFYIKAKGSYLPEIVKFKYPRHSVKKTIRLKK